METNKKELIALIFAVDMLSDDYIDDKGCRQEIDSLIVKLKNEAKKLGAPIPPWWR